MTVTAAREDVLKVREVAHRLDTTTDMVYRMVREGRLRHVRLGRLIRIPETALADFLAGLDENEI